MDVNTLLEHLGVLETQSRNEETLRIEEEALHRETKSQLYAVQEQLSKLRDREKQLIEKTANLTALKDTLETTNNQLNGDLKSSKVEMTILKEFAAKQEALLKAAKLDFLQRLEEINERMLKRNAEFDKVMGWIRGDHPSYADEMNGKEETKRLSNEKDSMIKTLNAEIQALKDENNACKDELKAVTEEQEKDRKYPLYIPSIFSKKI